MEPQLFTPASESLSLEIRRKLIHLPALIIPIGLFYFPYSIALPLLFSVTVASVLVETLRLRSKTIQRVFMWIFGPVLRRHEENRMTGSTALLLSSSLCCLALLILEGGAGLSREARLSLFYAFAFLILGDAAAAVVGKRWGAKKLFGDKTVAGSLACFALCFMIYLAARSLPGLDIPFVPVLAAAAVTTALEALPVKWDDNLIVPVAGAAGLYAMLTAGVR
jgi:dolichol kinase